ncbi:MAG: hypothetical protein SVT52_06355 [Planctomycetota bacterium]|nr:hypothetical protein [Planctomycetota bacterium]
MATVCGPAGWVAGAVADARNDGQNRAVAISLAADGRHIEYKAFDIIKLIQYTWRLLQPEKPETSEDNAADYIGQDSGNQA